MLSPQGPSKIGRYEIKALIGAGGMGSLYLARDTNPNTYRLVALKLLHANFYSDDLRERFGREARSLAALNHPNVVNIYDSGEFQFAPFIVMEYVRGETLAEKIKRQAPVTLAQKIKWMMELCGGLEHAHEAGIIHRDIKPANLMIDHQGRLKLLDFGIARVEAGQTQFGAQMTQVNVRIGTPGYMSPEQIEGGDIDRRSDIFAVGAVLYELLTYREAFTGGSTRQIENKVLQSQPTPLASLVPGLDAEIQAIVEKALEKDPDKRYQDATEFEQALERARWRLGPAETPTPAARATPVPAGRRVRDSRADAAYQRARGAYEEGALETAKRFAIEALAEDVGHAPARILLDELDPRAWQSLALGPAGPPSAPPPAAATVAATGPGASPFGSDGGTMVSTHGAGGVVPPDATVVSTRGMHAGPLPADATVVSARAPVSGGLPWPWPWLQSRQALLVGGVAALIVVIGLAALAARWLMSPDSAELVLTVTRPIGGTITGAGITCGSGGANCTVRVARGETIELDVAPDQNFRFTGFTGDCAPSGRTVMNDPRTCGATFEEELTAAAGTATAAQLLTIAPPTGGTVIGAGILCGTRGKDCSVSLAAGTHVRLEGWADQGFTFQGFTGDCLKGETQMTAPRTCGATFTPRGATASRTATATPGGAGTGSRGTTPGGTSPATPGGPPGSASTTSSEGRGSEEALPPPPPKLEPREEELVAPPPPPKPPDPREVAQKEIEEVLERYRAAYEALSFDGIRSVFPRAPDAIREQFRQIKGVQMAYAGAPKYVELDPFGGTALVEIGVTRTLEMRSGSGRPTHNNVARFNFRKSGADNVWEIAQVVFK